MTEYKATAHPITPPPELVQQWWLRHATDESLEDIVIEAAQWGADQELEACIDWIANARNSGMGWDIATSLSADLRAARRPKPPSLKEQALDALDRYKSGQVVLTNETLNTIRRALEQLDD